MLNKTNILVIFILFTLGCINLPESAVSNATGQGITEADISSTQSVRPNVRNINEELDRKCFHCGTAIDTLYNFCHMCGREQPQACKGCGGPINSGNFCGICGIRINST